MWCLWNNYERRKTLPPIMAALAAWNVKGEEITRKSKWGVKNIFLPPFYTVMRTISSGQCSLWSSTPIQPQATQTPTHLQISFTSLIMPITQLWLVTCLPMDSLWLLSDMEISHEAFFEKTVDEQTVWWDMREWQRNNGAGHQLSAIMLRIVLIIFLSIIPLHAVYPKLLY